MLHGPLHEIGLVEVLQLLERGGRTGILRVTGPDPTVPRRIALRAGRIVAVLPDADDAALARALVRQHLAVPADDAADGPWAVPPAIRAAARERLARRALGTMLSWTRGRVDFTEDPEALGPLDWSPDGVVLEMVRREGWRLDLAQALDDFRAVPALDTTAHDDGPLHLDPLDWRVLDAADGRRDVAAIAAHLDEPLEEVGASVQRLVEAAIFRVSAPVADPLREARVAVQAGRHDEAVQRLAARLAAVPGDAEACRLLGLAEVGAGRFGRAVAAWEAWAAADPARAEEAATLARAAHTMLEALQEPGD